MYWALRTPLWNEGCQTLPVFCLASDLLSNKMVYEYLVPETGEGRLLWLKLGVRGGPTRQPCSTKAQGPSLMSLGLTGQGPGEALPSTVAPTCSPLEGRTPSQFEEGPTSGQHCHPAWPWMELQPLSGPYRPPSDEVPGCGRQHLLQLSSPSYGHPLLALVWPPQQGKHVATPSCTSRFAGGRTLPPAQALGTGSGPLAGQQLHPALRVGPTPLNT